MNMNTLNEAVIYYAPGQLVRVRHEVENRPIMWIVEKSSRNMRNPNTNEVEPVFQGMKCRWFDTNMNLQESIFNTKDLELVD